MLYIYICWRQRIVLRGFLRNDIRSFNDTWYINNESYIQLIDMSQTVHLAKYFARARRTILRRSSAASLSAALRARFNVDRYSSLEACETLMKISSNFCSNNVASALENKSDGAVEKFSRPNTQVRKFTCHIGVDRLSHKVELPTRALAPLHLGIGP